MRKVHFQRGKEEVMGRWGGALALSQMPMCALGFRAKPHTVCLSLRKQMP